MVVQREVCIAKGGIEQPGYDAANLHLVIFVQALDCGEEAINVLGVLGKWLLHCAPELLTYVKHQQPCARAPVARLRGVIASGRANSARRRVAITHSPIPAACRPRSVAAAAGGRMGDATGE